MCIAGELTEKYNVKVEIRIIEFSDEQDVTKFIEEIKNFPIDFLVNNAGFGVNEVFWKSDIKKQEGMVRTHILAPINLIHAVLPAMIRNKSGNIINLSSIGAFLPSRKNAVYGGTKAFLKNFTEALHLELYDTGIKVQALCPGFTHTDFHEKLNMREEDWEKIKDIKWMEPDEVVKLSLNSLNKGKVICIPGLKNKLLILISSIVPRSVYYKIILALY